MIAFGEESLKTVCFDSFILKQALKTDAERLFKSFLARNELVASVLALFLRASRYPGSAANLLGSREQQRVATAAANKRDDRPP